MLNGKRIVLYTFAGRRRYLEMLVHYSLRCRPFVDKHYLCVHTTDKNDIRYIQELCQVYPDYFSMVDIDYRDGFHFHLFYKYFGDPDTFYVKLDDDVCWMENGAIETLVRYKAAHPEILVAFSNTVNNGICSHLHQRMGLVNSPVTIEYDGHFVTYATEPHRIRYVKDVHESFLKSLSDGTTDRYKSFTQWLLNEVCIRVSINCICMTGLDTGAMLETMLKSANDEGDISEVLPKKLGRINAICGKSLIAHFAFCKQREYLETQTDILNRYRALVGLGPWSRP